MAPRLFSILVAGAFYQQRMADGNPQRIDLWRDDLHESCSHLDWRVASTTRVAADVRSAVVKAIGLLKATLLQGITLEIRLDEDLFVLGDPTHPHQAVTNLCTNAVSSMSEGGVLVVGLKRVYLAEPRTLSNGAERSSRVRGVGITADVLEHMFNPFFTTRKAGEGMNRPGNPGGRLA